MNVDNVIKDIISKDSQIAVIGMGYVGFPIARAFSEKGYNVIGFDINFDKIQQYNQGVDPTGEIGEDEVNKLNIEFTSDETSLFKASIFIVAVPTPVNSDNTPDLTPVIEASKLVANYIRSESVVIFESTVYPGCTEDVCVPILEKISGLSCGDDFKVGYSPERINPGDKIHRFDTICKIISGNDEESLRIIKYLYDEVIDAGTFSVSNIRTAEAIKVVENSQRDINIAFMNELAMVFDRMDIDTNEVINGMNTKWNALGFRPGLVGGHCIGVDPYYFTYEAEKLGYHSQIIINGRNVNNSMGAFIAEAAVKKMIIAGQAPQKSKVAILGLTFKENCHDIRNSKVYDIITTLREYGINPIVSDPWVDKKESSTTYSVTLCNMDEIRDMDCIIIAVAHDDFKKITLPELQRMYRDKNVSGKVLIDVKGIFSIQDLKNSDLIWWRL